MFCYIYNIFKVKNTRQILLLCSALSCALHIAAACIPGKIPPAKSMSFKSVFYFNRELYTVAIKAVFTTLQIAYLWIAWCILKGLFPLTIEQLLQYSNPLQMFLCTLRLSLAKLSTNEYANRTAKPQLISALFSCRQSLMENLSRWKETKIDF